MVKRHVEWTSHLGRKFAFQDRWIGALTEHEVATRQYKDRGGTYMEFKCSYMRLAAEVLSVRNR